MTKRHPIPLALFIVLAGCIAVSGCASSVPSTEFTNPEFDFSYVERVAVIPFENLSNDRQAGLRATRITITELLASQAVDVVEYGEVQAALLKLPGAQYGRVQVPSTEQIQSLGRELNVQAMILGAVTQSESIRSGSVSSSVVNLDMHMVEVETGTTVWAATHTEKGKTTSAKILGTGGQPVSEITRRCVQVILKTLLE